MKRPKKPEVLMDHHEHGFTTMVEICEIPVSGRTHFLWQCPECKQVRRTGDYSAPVCDGVVYAN